MTGPGQPRPPGGATPRSLKLSRPFHPDPSIAKMEAELQKEIQKENKLIREYIKTHPFPSYDVMRKAILKQNEIDWLAEFGEYNYNCLKICYENILDDAICKKMGQLIHARGGFTAMQENYETFKYLSPLAQSLNIAIRTAYKCLEYSWEGVGEWRC